MEVARVCSLRTGTWTNMLWNSKPLPGLCVVISENMVLKVPFYEVIVGPEVRI